MASRLNDMFKLREDSAESYRNLGLEMQHPNGDQIDFPDLRGNFTKGLPHNASTGLVDRAAFDSFYANLTTLTPTPASQMPFVDPMAGLAFDTEGPDAQQLALPAPPKFNSDLEIAEIAENYWMALLRDVNFDDYPTHPLAIQAAAHLSTFPSFAGVTAATLFRGPIEGNDVGPYLSQFLIWDVPYGAQKTPNQIAFSLPPGQDFLTDWASYLAVQNGVVPAVNPPVAPINPRYIQTGRDISQYVHIDELFQGYLNACLVLITPGVRGGWGALSDQGNPYSGADTSFNPPKARHMSQTGFGTLGEPNFKTMTCEVATRALKQVWHQKWMVHRRLRPEEFGGRLEVQRTNPSSSFISPAHLAQLRPVLTALEAALTAQGKPVSWLLPMAFPEGCPLHPAYGAGHATVAGACVTVLKALFYEESTMKDLGITPRVINAAGQVVNATTSQADPAKMTVLGELNKLASNVGLGRNIAGVHWRTDYTESLILGERIALYYLQEYVNCYPENVTFNIRTFGGNNVTISKNEHRHFDHVSLPLEAFSMAHA